MSQPTTRNVFDWGAASTVYSVPDKRTETAAELRQRQAIRLRRYAMAAGSAFVTMAMLTTLYAQDLVATRTYAIGIAAMVTGLAVFFVIFKAGWNLRARDPSLTGPMMLCASAIIFWLMYDSTASRATLGPYLCIVILFGVFRFSKRKLFLAVALQLIAYVAMLALLWHDGRRGGSFALDMGRFIVIVCVLPLLAWVGGHINDLRKRLHERKLFFQQIWNACKDVVLVIERDGRIHYANPALTTVLGYDPAQTRTLRASALQLPETPADDSLLLAATLDAPLKTNWETLGLHADGAQVPLEVTITRTVLDGREMTVAFLSDITIRKVAENKIRHLALHDTLTGLPNRLLLRDRLELALAYAARHGTAVWVLFLDFDRFKQINDTLGHQVGDLVLTTLAGRMKRACRATDTAA
ncbi:MAG TPA: diguanylate cyclase, partial [Burkholderiaceae bacterium]